MFKLCVFVVVLCLSLVVEGWSEPPRQRVRFPGPAKISKLPSVLAQQELAPAPYPPAGAKPEPPFELPTEEAANFPSPQPTYLPPTPDQTYGPPDQVYGPPDQTYGPPDQTYGPPDQIYGPPDQTYGPPDDNNGLPHIQRLVAFRPLRRPAPFRRPIAKPAKLRRPTQPKPAKLIVSVGTRPQQSFAQLPPIIRNPVHSGNRIIAYSDRFLNM